MRNKKKTMEETNRSDHKVVAVVANSLPQENMVATAERTSFLVCERFDTKGKSPFGEFLSVHSSFRNLLDR